MLPAYFICEGEPDVQKCKLFIGGLSYETTEASLKDYFQRFGDVVDCCVMRDPNSKRSRGFGFVTYKDPAMVDIVQANWPHILDGREVEPKRAVPKEDTDPQNTNKLFIGGLNYETTEQSLRAHFGKWGEITECIVMRDPFTRCSRGFGFITYKHPSDLDIVLVNKPHIVDGREVEPKKAIPKEATESEQNRKLFIGGLNYDTTDYSLKTYFEKFGEILECSVMREQDTKCSRGFAFIVYKELSSIDKVMAQRPHIVDGREVEPKRAVAREITMPTNWQQDGSDQQHNKLFVGGLNYETTEEVMKQHFGRFGEVTECVVMRDSNTKHSRGFGFITYRYAFMVDDALDVWPHTIDGKEVELKRAIPKEELGHADQMPRRNFGGDFQNYENERNFRGPSKFVRGNMRKNNEKEMYKQNAMFEFKKGHANQNFDQEFGNRNGRYGFPGNSRGGMGGRGQPPFMERGGGGGDNFFGKNNENFGGGNFNNRGGFRNQGGSFREDSGGNFGSGRGFGNQNNNWNQGNNNGFGNGFNKQFDQEPPNWKMGYNDNTSQRPSNEWSFPSESSKNNSQPEEFDKSGRPGFKSISGNVYPKRTHGTDCSDDYPSKKANYDMLGESNQSNAGPSGNPFNSQFHRGAHNSPQGRNQGSENVDWSMGVW